MANEKQELLKNFAPITLDEMAGIRLMNRIDTKYLLTAEELQRFLHHAAAHYRVQEVNGERNIAYHTVYLDTDMQQMYRAHECGHAVREKIRVRTYLTSGIAFLEVKHKNNKGRTDKKRIPVSSVDTLCEDGGDTFLQAHAWYKLEQLSPQLENRFRRITLVNKAKTERLTIDSQICFANLLNGNTSRLDNIVVLELKRDGRTYSPACEMLRNMHISRSSFSKYCMGCVLTDEQRKQNRFKTKLRHVLKLNNQL